MVIEQFLRDADLRRATIGETDQRQVIDDVRRVLLQRHDADLARRNQAVGLAEEQMRAPVVLVVARPGLAEPRVVAVGLHRIRGPRGAQEVHLAVPGDQARVRRLSLHAQGNPALPCAEPELVLVVELALRERDTGICVVVDVRNLVALAVDAGEFEEAAERDGNAADLKSAQRQLLSGRRSTNGLRGGSWGGRGGLFGLCRLQFRGPGGVARLRRIRLRRLDLLFPRDQAFLQLRKLALQCLDLFLDRPQRFLGLRMGRRCRQDQSYRRCSEQHVFRSRMCHANSDRECHSLSTQ